MRQCNSLKVEWWLHICNSLLHLHINEHFFLFSFLITIFFAIAAITLNKLHFRVGAHPHYGRRNRAKSDPHLRYQDKILGSSNNLKTSLRGRHKLYKSCGDPRIFRRFLPDLYFCTSVDRRPIFMTLNRCDHWVSDRLPITVGHSHGDRPGLSCKWPVFPGSVRRPSLGLLPMPGKAPANLRSPTCFITFLLEML